MTTLQRKKVVRKLRRNRRSGSAVIEMALVLMLLLNVAFGLVEFGYYLYVRHSYEGAAREGARVAIIAGMSNSNVTTAVTSYLSSIPILNSGYTTTIQSPLGTNCSVGTLTAGTTVYVNVTNTWGVAGAGFSPLQLMPKTKTIQGIAAMSYE